MDKSEINDIRAFNRYYTNIIGLLDKGYIDTGYSLTEARVLFELSQASKIDTSDIINTMLIDKGYLSRVLKKLEKGNLITRTVSSKDARASQLSLTEKGVIELNMLNKLTNLQFEKLLKDLSSTEVQQMIFHMNSITEILKRNQQQPSNE